MRTNDFANDVSNAARILDQRAKRLAHPSPPPANGGELYLVARVGTEAVAVPTARLRSVARTPPVTRLPIDGDCLMGLVALGGEVVPVVDLGRLLDLPETAPEVDPLLLVIEDGDSQLALRVDGVEGQQTIHAQLVDRIDLSDSVGRAGARLATPVGPEGLLVLDVDAALADPRLAVADAGSFAG